MPKETEKPEGAKPRRSSAKTSKTAHVLGLLTSPPDTEEPVAAISRAPAKPSPSDDQVVEAQVREALEEELGAALEPSPAPGPGAEAATELPAEAALEPPAPKAPLSEPVMMEPAVIPIQTRMPDRDVPEEGDSHVVCFNVMQALVEAKADKYIRLFGLCSCPRCRIDVIALSLTKLPPKYVVTEDREIVPLLSMYEGQYNASIVSHVMNSCKQVMEHPRH